MDNTEKGLSLDELGAGVYRHRYLAGVIVIASVLLGGVYVAVKPRIYAATTVLRVEVQTLPEPLLSQTVTERIESRLATVRHELLSRPILAQVIGELDLYQGLREADGLEAAVEAMRASLEIKVEGENAFAVTYRGRDPEVVAQVANRLPEVYVELASEERAQAAERATAIFDAQLAQIRPRVEGLETRLTTFKTANAGKLPEALESNLRQLDRLTGLTEATLTSLADAQRRRTALARLGVESSAQATRLAVQLEESRRALQGLQTRFTDGHPDVLAAARDVQAIRSRFEAAALASRQGDSESSRLDAEIVALGETARGYEERMEEFLRRVDATPAVGAELGALNRDYEAVRAKYQTLVSRQVEVELAQDLERRQRASLFRVVEGAYPPRHPAEPDAASSLGLALLLGLGLALAATVYRASRDTSIRSAADARQRLGLPVLAAIPSLERRGGA